MDEVVFVAMNEIVLLQPFTHQPINIEPMKWDLVKLGMRWWWIGKNRTGRAEYGPFWFKRNAIIAARSAGIQLDGNNP